MSTFKDGLSEDLDNVFFNNLEFAESVLYSNGSDPDFNVNAIFDNEHEEVDPDTGLVVTDTNPQIRVKEKDFLTIPLKLKDNVTVRGVQYYIVDKQPDGVGTILLLLNEVN